MDSNELLWTLGGLAWAVVIGIGMCSGRSGAIANAIRRSGRR
ncbi:hypothetical protein [Chloroflexus sp.]|nr:hypothetical protein [Chloroflexus sp.]